MTIRCGEASRENRILADSKDVQTAKGVWHYEIGMLLNLLMSLTNLIASLNASLQSVNENVSRLPDQLLTGALRAGFARCVLIASRAR